MGAVSGSSSRALRRLSEAEVRQRQRAAMRHGAQSDAALAPLIVSTKKALLARMGLRQRDLTWAGREIHDSYCRAKSKVLAIDRWLEVNPLVYPDGGHPAVLKLYFVSLNASTRLLEALRGVISEMAREDVRFDKALEALAAEGRRTRVAG
jgi:hypothetical protein